MNYKKILVLGSGAIKIGEAGEFDYSGSQALKAFKEEGIKTVLINPNIATVQTSNLLADTIYFLPVTEEFVEEVIKKERPDAVALSFGGQTALNCGIALYKKGVFEMYEVEVLGTPIKGIELTEDREGFAKHLRNIGLSTPDSKIALSVDEALETAREMGFPVMVRAGFTLGGQKSGVVFDEEGLVKQVNSALSFSSQVLVEKYLHHYKEIEYEIVRDEYDNCIAVCNMENFDPLGIHTGDSVVVAPSQTLNNFEYQRLREIAIELVRTIGVIGECNVQFALNPNPENEEGFEYYIIEMNARLSRSSALASKATGYPLAYVAAKLMLGKALFEVQNKITQTTQAFFEPALDYIVVKMPRWDLEKFSRVEEKLGSGMKSVGEVMAIGRTFEEALQKAIRMTDMRILDLSLSEISKKYFSLDQDGFIKDYVLKPNPKRVLALIDAFRKGFSIDDLYKMTGIDRWFLYRLENITKLGLQLMSEQKRKEIALSKDKLLMLKQYGFSDRRIAELSGKAEEEVYKLRKEFGIRPSFLYIDTLAGEFPANTNYLYASYNAQHNDIEPFHDGGVVVLGSGPYRIGSSVEFDWSCVNTAQSLKKYSKKSIIVNCNPETVSTDYDVSDRLYFEELTFERVDDIYNFENSHGVIISVGGQTPNNLAPRLYDAGVPVLGTDPVKIDNAENRNKFSALLDKLKIPQPEWEKLNDEKAAFDFANRVGYPVLARPSFVLSGTAMAVCYSEQELEKFIENIVHISDDRPIIISKFYRLSKEIEIDAIAQSGKLMTHAMSEHIEHAGVHSGDATMIFPPQRVFTLTEKKIMKYTRDIVKALNITGPVNIQFLAKDNHVMVIEANLRASRTFPLISKVTHINYGELITDAIFQQAKEIELDYPDYVLVKSAQFSFSRLEGSDPVLQVDMASTGEVASFGDTVQEALYKSILSTGAKFDEKAVLLSVGGIVNKKVFLSSARMLYEAGFKLYATAKTTEFLQERGIKAELVQKVYSGKKPDVIDLINNKKVSFVINISSNFENRSLDRDELSDGYLIRRATIDKNIYLITNLQLARMFIEAITTLKKEDLQIKSWKEYNKSYL